MTRFCESSWTGNQNASLRELCASLECLSGNDIANRLNTLYPERPDNFTRNGVIAKITRENIPWTNRRKIRDGAIPLKRPPSRNFSGENVNYNPLRKEHNSINKITQKSTKTNRINGMVGDAIFSGDGKPIMKITSDLDCRWPAGDSKQGLRQFCGKLTMVGSPYCPEHSRIGFQSIPAKRSIHRETPTVEQVE